MEIVTPKPRVLRCHMYDDTLTKIIGTLEEGERGIVLPGERRTTWHTFRRVLTLESAGWVEADSIQLIGARGEGET